MRLVVEAMRRHGKVDANQASIVRDARKMGCEVLSLAPLGNGAPDLLIRTRTRRLLLVEVKVPTGKVNALQAEFAAKWPVTVIRDTDDLLKLLHRTKGG